MNAVDQPNKPHDDLIRAIAVMVTAVWGVCKVATIMGWAVPSTPELAVQSLSGTDAVMSFVAGYLFAGTVQRRLSPPAQSAVVSAPNAEADKP